MKHMALYCAVLCIALFSIPAMAADTAQNRMAFWDVTRTGTNCFNKVPTEAWFSDAEALGVRWVRLAIDKWKGERRDFLVGNADGYTGLVEKDAQVLDTVLGWAVKHNIKIVLAPLTLPGCRYRQNNGGRYDGRLWAEKTYWKQAAAYWKDIAARYCNHPAIVGYNILNEPAPELGRGVAEHAPLGDVSRLAPWYAQVKGTAADLPLFYTEIIAAIRTVDVTVPVMVDSGWYAQPATFSYWKPLPDANVLYAFHMYEPYAFTSGKNWKRKKPYAYPGTIPFADAAVDWNRDALAQYMAPVFAWAAANHIPRTRLVAAEFGVMRRNNGAQQYLEDVLSILEAQKIHWAFYSFREDEWDGYDYEVGTKGLGWKYWQAVERGEHPEVPRKDTPLFSVIKSKLQ